MTPAMTNRSPYRLVALDLDGTLIRPDGVISERNRNSLLRLRAAGTLVTLVTGRTRPAVEAIVHDLGLTTPIITYNGAEILDPRTGETLFHCPIPATISRRLIEFMRGKKLSPVVFVNSHLFSDKIISPQIAPRSGLNGMTCHVIGEAIEQLEFAPEKIGVIVPKTKLLYLAKHLNEISGNRVVASRSYATLLEMTNHLATKGHALRWLARYLRVPRTQVVAIGDSDADKDMIAWAGLGVAMGNGTRLVRSSCDYVTGSVETDGVAEAIERFCLCDCNLASYGNRVG